MVIPCAQDSLVDDYLPLATFASENNILSSVPFLSYTVKAFGSDGFIEYDETPPTAKATYLRTLSWPRPGGLLFCTAPRVFNDPALLGLYHAGLSHTAGRSGWPVRR
jgi:hypothetical protein